MEESLEDILKESRRVTERETHNRVNRKLWIAVGITTLVIIIGWPLAVPMPGMSMAERFQFGILGGLISFPIFSAMFAIPIALIPIKNWDYGKRFLRVFLIVMLVFESLVSLMVLIAGVINLFD